MKTNLEKSWEDYVTNRLKTMGNSHLWDIDEAYKNFKAGYVAATKNLYTDEDLNDVVKLTLKDTEECLPWSENYIIHLAKEIIVKLNKNE